MGGMFKSKKGGTTGRARVDSTLLDERNGGGGGGAGGRRCGQRRGRLLVEVLRARELDAERSFDPYVAMLLSPASSAHRVGGGVEADVNKNTAPAAGGGVAPVWGASERNQFVLEVMDETVSLEVEVRCCAC